MRDCGSRNFYYELLKLPYVKVERLEQLFETVMTAINLGLDLYSRGIFFHLGFFGAAAEFRLGFAFRSMLDRIS